MKLYNTLTRTVEEFTPHEAGKVKMYTCGPTVYNFAHIGNLRTYLMEDVLEKTFRYIGYDVKRVMNITDIGHLSSDADTGEDKMLLGARREHKTVLELAQYYTDAFFADCAALNIKKPDVVQPATGCVEDFIEVIASLMERGFAYKAGGNIYFDTSACARGWTRTKTSATKTISCCGSPSPSSKTRRSNGTVRGASATPAGTSNVRASR